MPQQIDSTNVFRSKAEIYDRFRWRYNADAIRTVFETSEIGAHSQVADIGAGTGILTVEFSGKVKIIYAIEPNDEMRAIAARKLAADPSCQVINAVAEATALPDDWLDLIVVGQAVHWFEPESTKLEFHRILKPGGWLAILRNHGLDPKIGKALDEVFPPECDTVTHMIGAGQSPSFYFCADSYTKYDFPFLSKHDWETFFGGLLSASFAPTEEDTSFAGFKRRARSVFEQFRKGDYIYVHAATELYIGQINCQGSS